MRPQLHPEGLKKSAWWEHLLRFVFGGAVTVGTGLVGHHWGDVVGGLFLACPAILPASLALVKRHDGRHDAVADARGARLGALGLAAFGFVVWPLAPSIGPVALALATVAWLVVAVGSWWLVHGRAG